MPIVTLMTDFGTRDHFVGVLKGVIWGIAPEARIADITHEILPQNVRQAGLLLSRACPYFPPQTVHVIVVDPGVGTTRRPIAARIGDQFFVAPDNGLLTLMLEKGRSRNWQVEIVHLDRPRFWLKNVSNLFHGRDVFAPVGAHLANGVPIDQVGTPVFDPILLEIPRPEQTTTGLRGEVNNIDHFGNISCNINGIDLSPWMDAKSSLRFRLCGREIRGLSTAFGDHSPGSLVALIGSSDNLVISEVNGDAAGRLKASVGDPVEVVAGE